MTYQDVTILARKDEFYIIRAPVDVAEEIAHLQATGAATFSLASGPDDDQRQVDATALGETTNQIIQKYGLPIPQTVSRRLPARADADAAPSASADPAATPTRPRAPARPARGPRAAAPHPDRLAPSPDGGAPAQPGRLAAAPPYEVTMPDRSNPAAPTPTLRTDAAPHAPRGA